jgi:hypothetical protein
MQPCYQCAVCLQGLQDPRAPLDRRGQQASQAPRVRQPSTQKLTPSGVVHDALISAYTACGLDCLTRRYAMHRQKLAQPADM